MKAIDVSQWQGNINWNQVDAPIAIIKISGGDAGLYYDSKANQNYYSAKAAGKAVGMYHFAGGGDPYQEADFFLNGCSPFEPNDVFVLDWEITHPDPVGWCKAFIQRCIERTGVKPLIYLNQSTIFAYDWTPVVNQDVGLWVAHWGYTPDQDVPIKWWMTYVLHQYSSRGRVPGIIGDVDLNEWFGSVDQFRAYGFKAAPAPIQDVKPPVADPVPPQPAPTPPVATPPATPPPIVDPPIMTPPAPQPPDDDGDDMWPKDTLPQPEPIDNAKLAQHVRALFESVKFLVRILTLYGVPGALAIVNVISPEWAAVIGTILTFVDKFIHSNKKIPLKGLLWF